MTEHSISKIDILGREISLVTFTLALTFKTLAQKKKRKKKAVKYIKT